MKVSLCELEAIDEALKFLYALCHAGSRKTVETRIAEYLGGDLKEKQRIAWVVVSFLRKLEATARHEIDSKLTVEIEMKEEK